MANPQTPLQVFESLPWPWPFVGLEPETEDVVSVLLLNGSLGWKSSATRNPTPLLRVAATEDQAAALTHLFRGGSWIGAERVWVLNSGVRVGVTLSAAVMWAPERRDLAENDPPALATLDRFTEFSTRWFAALGVGKCRCCPLPISRAGDGLGCWWHAGLRRAALQRIGEIHWDRVRGCTCADSRAGDMPCRACVVEMFTVEREILSLSPSRSAADLRATLGRRLAAGPHPTDDLVLDLFKRDRG